MPIRTGETNGYLITTWHFIVYHESGEMKQVDFTSSKSGRINMYNEIKRLVEKKVPFKIYGVWQGQYKTDVFDLDPAIYLKRLKEYINLENQKLKVE